MSLLNVSALFMTTMSAHILLIGFTLWRIAKRQQVADRDKVDFAVSPLARSTTPETAALAMQDDTEVEVENAP